MVAIDLDKLAGAYYSKVSYSDVLSVESRYGTERSTCSGSSDSLHPVQWVMVADWHDLAYEKLLSMKNTFLPDLVIIRARVTELLSQNPELADKYEPLKIFLHEYVEFLSLSKDDFAVLSKNKCFMLMNLIKSFVAHFDDSLSSYEYGKQLNSLRDTCMSQIPELQQRMVIKVLSTNPSGRSESAFLDSARQSEWVRLDDWHDLAHRELKAIRRVYLPQLLKAYERVLGLWSENPELSTKSLEVKIFLLEYCKLLTMSRANIGGLSRGECYVIMMLIKNQLWKQLLSTGSQSQIPEIQDELDIRVDFVDPSSACESASSDTVRLVQSEWDARAHQELESLRNSYSSQLDKIFKMVYGLWSQSSLPKNNYDSTVDAIGRSLNFLVMSRADVLDLSKEGFDDNMRLFKAVVRPLLNFHDHCECQSEISNPEQPMNNQGNQSFRREASTDSARMIQSERFTNLNDRLYEELQVMRKKYMPVLLKAYHKLNQQVPGKRRQKAMDNVYKCFEFLEKPRSLMAVVPRESHEIFVKFVEVVVARCKVYLTPASTMKKSSFGYCEVERNLYERD